MDDNGCDRRGDGGHGWRVQLCAVPCLLVLTTLLAAALPAQTDPEADEQRARVARNESEIDSLRRRVAELEARTADAELRREALVNLYGDIGFRYHQLFESGTETFNRPEFRLHLGVYGTAFNLADQRIRYDLRLTTAAIDATGKPVPTLAWLPLPGYGTLPTLAVDRFLIEYGLNRTLFVTAGRFPSDYAGTEILFDRDYHFQGLSQSLRFDRFFGESMRRIIPRLELVSVQSYLAQNNVGLPTIETEVPPLYLGAQLRMDFAPFEDIERSPEGRLPPDVNSELEFRIAAGIHWYEGEERFAEVLGLGYIQGTTNVLNSSNQVQSQFMVGEVYAEIVAFRSRSARLRGWFHGIFNFHAEPQISGRGERNEAAFDAGISWGMERMQQRWDFHVAFRYFYIEADALVPEFNNEARNTNIKGWEVEIEVRIFPTVSAFALFGNSERENYDLNGFGLPSSDNPERSAGQSFRMRFGFYLEF